MLAEEVPLPVDDRARTEPPGEPPAQLRGEVAVDEAELLGVRLGRRDQLQPRGLGTDVRLALHPTEREECGAELGLVETVEGVGLVLAGLHRPVERPGFPAPADPRVVPGGDVGRADGAGPREEDAELDPLIAPDAGVGGPAGCVVLLEAGHDLGSELTLQVPGQVADAEAVGHPAGILDRVDGAAAPIANLLAIARPHRQGDAEGLDATSHAAGGGHAAVDATRHGDGHHGAPGQQGEGVGGDERGSGLQGGDGHP